MSDHNEGFSPAPTPPPAVSAPPARVEDVARGLVFSLGAVLLGTALTIIAWRLGFVASITSFVLAAGAVFLYAKGAGTAPRKGLIPLIAIIVVGVVIAFFGVIVSDTWDAYDKYGQFTSQSRLSFIQDNVFRGEVIRTYGKDMTWFFLFGVLGVFSTLRRLLSMRA